MDDQNNPQEPTGFQPGMFLRFKLFLAKEKIIIIVILIMSAVSFGTAAYLLMTNKKPPRSNSPIPKSSIATSSVTPTPKKTISSTPAPSSPTPTIILTNPTATWSAFVSPKYSYSIKYPPKWTAQITTQTDPKILEYVVFNPVATKAGTLSITLSYGTRTYSEALALDPQIGEVMTVASRSATKKNSKDSNGYKAVNVIVPFGANSIIFNAKDVFASLFNQMLSTLKLAE